tara:strand:+ start:189 stop:293 length:105 start_codon:yes stop_codon:yes gene_type:complete
MVVVKEKLRVDATLFPHGGNQRKEQERRRNNLSK